MPARPTPEYNGEAPPRQGGASLSSPCVGGASLVHPHSISITSIAGGGPTGRLHAIDNGRLCATAVLGIRHGEGGNICRYRVRKRRRVEFDEAVVDALHRNGRPCAGDGD